MTVNVWNSIFDNTDGILRITYRTGTIIMIKPVGILAQKSNNVNNFWLLYLDAIIGSDIPEKNEEWFV